MTGESGKALPETAENRSSRGAAFLAGFQRLNRLWTALLAAGVVGAALTIAADFATLRSVHVLTASCSDLAAPSLRGSCVTRGHEEHAYALVLLGAAALVMVWGATVGRSRPAALATALLGAAVLVIGLAIDWPRIHRTGLIGEAFEQAHGHAGPALWMEIAGGALLFVTGMVATSRRPRRPRKAERERRRRAERRARAET